MKKKIIAILFIFLFVSSATEFRELYRLPFLVNHYIKHKNANNGLSFFDFLKKHYIRESRNDNDDQEDSKLPFKSSFENTISIFSAEHSFVSETIIFEYDHSYFNYYHSWIPSTVANAVFRPPKLS